MVNVRFLLRLQIQLSREPDPYSNCTKGVVSSNNVYQELYPVNYTSVVSLYVCNHVIEKSIRVGHYDQGQNMSGHQQNVSFSEEHLIDLEMT